MIEITPVRRSAVISHPLIPDQTLASIKKFLLWIGGVFAVFIVLNVASYFIFQRVTMPMTKLYGNNVSFMSYGALENDINERLATEKLKITYSEKSITVPYSDLGITFDSDKTFAFSNDRSIWNLPLVQLILNGTAQIQPSYSIDQSRLEASLSNLVSDTNIPAKDAVLVFPDSKDGEFTITQSSVGQVMNAKVAAEQFMEELQTLDYTSTSVEIEPKIVAPAATVADLEDEIETAREVIETPLIITDANGKEAVKLHPERFMHMMTSAKGDISVDPILLEQYVEEELSTYFYTETVARRVNSGIVSDAGKSGLGLDTAHAMEMISTALPDPEVRKVSLKTRMIEAPSVIDGVYPKTGEGLATLLRDFDNSKYGEYNLIVRSMKDGGIGASQDATPVIIPASTYKAFIAYAALKSIERGEMTLDTVTPHGTVRDCMYEMIHVSTDHCAISIQDHMGWAKVDKIIRDAGFVDTKINNQDFNSEKYTTAIDEYRLISGLYRGTLLNKEHTNHLLDLMKNQIYREGIPAGSAPSIVADKIGFYALREHDVGIVYAPQGDYVIIAMSYKGSFGEISQLARQVYQFFGN